MKESQIKKEGLEANKNEEYQYSLWFPDEIEWFTSNTKWPEQWKYVEMIKNVIKNNIQS